MNTRRLHGISGAGAAIALLGLAAFTTKPANAQVGVYYGGGPTIQSDKNAARNIGIGLGAAAAYELSKGKGTNALVLGVAALAAGSRYETDRKIENRDSVVCAPVREDVRWGSPAVVVREDCPPPVYVERPTVIFERDRGREWRHAEVVREEHREWNRGDRNSRVSHDWGHAHDRDNHDGWGHR